jgi:hypothetical protein
MMGLYVVVAVFLSSSFIFVFMFISMYDTITSPTFESNEDDDDDEEDDDASVVVAVATSVLSVRRLDNTVLAFNMQIFRSSTFKIIIVIINIISSSTAKAT